jgi:hypothetical protein
MQAILSISLKNLCDKQRNEKAHRRRLNKNIHANHRAQDIAQHLKDCYTIQSAPPKNQRIWSASLDPKIKQHAKKGEPMSCRGLDKDPNGFEERKKKKYSVTYQEKVQSWLTNDEEKSSESGCKYIR